MSAQLVLDRVQRLDQVEAFAPDDYVAALAAEVPAGATWPELEARDDAVRGAVTAIEAFATRLMRIRLDHALAGDHAVAPSLRKVFASTIAAYANNLPLLHARAGGGPSADVVVDAARAVLAVRDDLRARVLGLARDRAEAALPAVRAAATDRRSEDATRMRWSAVRRDLEAIVARPDHAVGGRFADRIAGLEPLLDEPDPAEEPSRWDLLELE